MESKFFDGLLVLLSADKIFKKTVREKNVFGSFRALFFSVLILNAAGICLFKILRGQAISFSLYQGLLLLISVYPLVIVSNGILSLFFDWLYSRTIKIKDRFLSSDFVDNYLVHLYILPFWFFAVFLFLNIRLNSKWILIPIILLVRILDIEARAIKIVYNLRLAQAYTIIFAKMSLISIGAGFGYLLNNLRF